MPNLSGAKGSAYVFAYYHKPFLFCSKLDTKAIPLAVMLSPFGANLSLKKSSCMTKRNFFL